MFGGIGRTEQLRTLNIFTEHRCVRGLVQLEAKSVIRHHWDSPQSDAVPKQPIGARASEPGRNRGPLEAGRYYYRFFTVKMVTNNR